MNLIDYVKGDCSTMKKDFVLCDLNLDIEIDQSIKFIIQENKDKIIYNPFQTGAETRKPTSKCRYAYFISYVYPTDEARYRYCTIKFKYDDNNDEIGIPSDKITTKESNLEDYSLYVSKDDYNKIKDINMKKKNQETRQGANSLNRSGDNWFDVTSGGNRKSRKQKRSKTRRVRKSKTLKKKSRKTRRR